MPAPGKNETQEHFHARCMRYPDLQNREQDQRNAICYSLWKEHKKKTKETNEDSMDNKKLQLDQKVYASTKDLKIEDDEERVFTCIITAEVLDRENEVLLTSGMDLSQYVENSPVLFNHHSDNPIGKCLAIKRDFDFISAKCQIMKRPDDFVGDFLPDYIWTCIKNGAVKGISPGFLPKEIRRPTSTDFRMFGSTTKKVISKSTLLEISVTPVQANQLAMIEAISTKSLKEYKDHSVSVNNKYDIPWLSGLNKDCTTMYVDKDLPKEHVIDGKTINLWKCLSVHELTEYKNMDDGIFYDEAHIDATEAEKKYVAALGIKWDDYEKYIDPIIKKTENKGNFTLPDDLDTRPYEQDGSDELKKAMKIKSINININVCKHEEPDGDEDNEEEVEQTDALPIEAPVANPISIPEGTNLANEERYSLSDTMDVYSMPSAVISTSDVPDAMTPEKDKKDIILIMVKDFSLEKKENKQEELNRLVKGTINKMLGKPY